MDVTSKIRNFIKDAIWTAVSLSIFIFVITKVRGPLLDRIFTGNTIGKFRDTNLEAVASITIRNRPNQDYRTQVEFTISSKDSLSQIFSHLQESEQEGYSHPAIRGQYFLVLNLKNKEKLSFRVLNIADRVCMLKLLATETGQEIESFRNDEFFDKSVALHRMLENRQ